MVRESGYIPELLIIIDQIGGNCHVLKLDGKKECQHDILLVVSLPLVLLSDICKQVDSFERLAIEERLQIGSIDLLSGYSKF